MLVDVEELCEGGETEAVGHPDLRAVAMKEIRFDHGPLGHQRRVNRCGGAKVPGVPLGRYADVVKISHGVVVSGEVPGELRAEEIHPLTIISFDQEFDTLAFRKGVDAYALGLAMLDVLEDGMKGIWIRLVGNRVWHFDETFRQLP